MSSPGCCLSPGFFLGLCYAISSCLLSLSLSDCLSGCLSVCPSIYLNSQRHIGLSWFFTLGSRPIGRLSSNLLSPLYHCSVILSFPLISFSSQKNDLHARWEWNFAVSEMEEIKIVKGWKRFGYILVEEKFQGKTTVGRFGFLLLFIFFVFFFLSRFVNSWYFLN